ncbi:hypothetical protein GOBAR_DD13817 [Gossypium barbadense]|nr:hypothetical protein GOBAR_DD13817 [Gossypium barbadense]
MVKLTMIARVTDGLPLAEGLDDGRDLTDAEMYKQQVKALFKNLSKGHNEASRMSVETGPYVFQYPCPGRVCYLTMCDRSYPKKLAFQYLEDLKNEFERVNGAQIETAARPYAFIKFDTFIQKTKKLYQDTRTQRNISKLNDELYEVHQIMTRNVQEVLGVGEKLDQVSQMSSRLTSESRIYADKARDLNRQALIRKWAPVAIVLGVVFLLFWVKAKLCKILKRPKIGDLPVLGNCSNQEEPVNVNGFRELARQTLPKMYYDFFTGGAEDQYTLKENEEAFHRITIQPRILVDTSSIDLSTMERLQRPEQHLHVYKRRDITAKLVQRAENNGYKAIVLTGDSPRHGGREADIKNKIIIPELKNVEGLLSTKIVADKGSNLDALANQTRDPSFSWENFHSQACFTLLHFPLADITSTLSFLQDIGWLKSITKLPILIKGLLTHEDALKALEVGAAGIIVSNHGGRQLDYCPPTISVLEEVVHAVGGKVPVFLDVGVRQGTDIFKAMALGAQAVLVGRPVLYGLAAKGENGVRRVLEMLKEELELTMALSGCSNVKEITRSHVRTKHDRQLLSLL